MYKRYRGWKRKPRRRPWYVYAALVVGSLIGLELLARLLASLTGVDPAFSNQSSSKQALVESYQLGFLSPEGKPYEELPHQGKLQAVRSPLMGYELVPQQKSEHWAINPQGFRDEEPVPPAKAPNEVRIFVLGGSMAFGQLSSNNKATFANQLETLLNNQVKDQQANPNRFQPAVLPYTADEVAKVLQRPPRIPERQYRVINAAVPGYASGNDLSRLIQEVSTYNPDMVLLLNSYEDLLLPSVYSGSDIPGLDALLAGERASMKSQVGQTIQGWLNRLYLVQGTQRYLLRSPQLQEPEAIPLNVMTDPSRPSLADNLAADEAELKARVDRYRNHLLQMARWSSASRKQLLIGLQPEISARSTQQISPAEQAILAELGENYSQRIKTSYPKLLEAAQQVTKASANVRVLDLHQLYAASNEQMFLSPTSLTDQGYAVLATQFYQSIVDQLAIEPQPYGS